MKLKPMLRSLIGFALLLFSCSLWAQSCTELFTDGITSNSNAGRITFRSGSRLIGSVDNILEAKNLSDFAGSNISCDGVSCTNTGSAGASNNYNSFSNNNNSISVGSGSSLSLSPGDYRNITVNTGATLILSAGDYHLWGDIAVSSSANIIVSGTGTARVFVRGDVNFSDSSQINSVGTVQQLLVYARGDITFGANAAGQGIFYTRNDFDLGSSTQLSGVVSGKDIELQNSATLTYDASVFSGDFSGFCTSPALVDHYAITHAVNFVTCEAAPIVISSHDSSDLSVTAGTTITLSTSSGLGDWSADGAALGTLNNGGANDGVANYSFGAGEQFVQLYLSHTSNVSNLDIDVSDGIASDQDGDPSEDPSLNFVDAALRFYANGVADNIATQISAKNSNIAPNAQTLTLRAVQTNSDTGACEAAIQGSQTVRLGFECQNPASCVPAESLTLNGLAVASNNNGTVTAFSDITLSFDASGIANIGPLNYSDAGLIRLHATIDVPAVTPDPAITLAGASNAFVAKPAGLCVRATGATSACAPPYSNIFANCSVFVAAASDFELEISGRGWDSALESDAEHCDNAITPNFQAALLLTHQIQAPVGGAAGTLLTGTANISADGNVLFDQQFDEVGVIDITASLSAPYINGETIAASSSALIGRFIPAEFLVSSPGVNEACTAFTYMDQPFSALYTLQAVNDNGNVTRNYAGEFARALESGYPAYGGLSNSPSINLTSRIDFSAGTAFDWPPVGDSSAGEGLATATVQLIRNPLNIIDGPFEVELGVQVLDDDGVAINSDLDLDVDADTANDYAALGQTLQRYGRLRLANAFGSELLPLSVPVIAEYYDGSRFIVNGSDNCSVIDPASVTLTDFSTTTDEPIVPADTSVNMPTLPTAVITGANTIEFTAPGAGNFGSLNLVLDIDSWLQFDWGSGAVSNPASRITFGSYRGDDRVIYRQEVLQ